MNQNQKYVLIGGVCVIIAAALYPPFYIDIPRLSTVNLGFSFVLDPPEYKRFRGSINVPLLLAEWAGTVLVCGALWFLFKDGDPAGPTKESPSRTDSKWDAPEPAASQKSGESGNLSGRRRFIIKSTTGLTPDEITIRKKRERDARAN